MTFAKLSAAAAAAFAMSSAAQAALQIDIVVRPDGTSIWSFSGSDVARANGSFSNDGGFSTNKQFFDLGDFTTLDFSTITGAGGTLTGNAAVGVDGQSFSITDLLLDDDLDTGAGSDDFSFTLDAPGEVTFSVGDLVTFAGQLTVTGAQLVVPAMGTTSNYGFSDALTLNISITNEVPLPAGAPLLLGGLAVGGVLRRMRRSNAA
ncbi:MAG: hypothetical protein V2I43_22305 [Parvularcula sp.]|jgi:hypothetical protein|nr:hypothetical protein [Parvularcula sp.]